MTRFLLTFSFIMVLVTSSMAQRDYSASLVFSPLFSWMKPDSDKLESDGVTFGFSYGIQVDKNFTENYALSSGIVIAHNGGRINDISGATTFNYRIVGKNKLQYVEIPILLKLRTNEIGRIIYYGTFGIVNGIPFRARNDGENVYSAVNKYNLYLQVGGGIEYNISGNTAIIAAIYFKNGFIDVSDESEKVLMHNFGIMTGVKF